jgi:hypothetical protein
LDNKSSATPWTSVSLIDAASELLVPITSAECCCCCCCCQRGPKKDEQKLDLVEIAIDFDSFDFFDSFDYLTASANAKASRAFFQPQAVRVRSTYG